MKPNRHARRASAKVKPLPVEQPTPGKALGRAVKRVFRGLIRSQPQLKTKFATNGNAPCPCKSGKKYRECCQPSY